MEMRRYMIAAVAAVFWFQPATAARVTFAGNSLPVIEEKGSAQSGLDNIFVINGLDGVTAEYRAESSGSPVNVLIYDNRGGGYATEFASVSRDGSVVTLSNLKGDCGYIVEEGTRRYYFWITDYSAHDLQLNSLRPAAEQDCDVVTLVLDGNAGIIPYYSINGRRMELSRDLKLSYSTLAYDEGSGNYAPSTAEETLESVEREIRVGQPLCDTQFMLAGDRFLEAWHDGQSVTSEMYVTGAVAQHTSAEQTSREIDNEKKGEADGSGTLGGSAPCEIKFTAAVTDAAIFREWQVSRSPEFEPVDLTYNSLEEVMTFNEAGTTYVRFVCANADGTCESYSDTYQILVGESALDCPNAFTPDSSPGVNDIWKVSYRSITEFECHIFNRWGRQLYHFKDPSGGWDGKFGGKFVPAGVYYYVIKAKGADGKSYNLSGDINVIYHR